ncbi:hypothetical protein WDW37_12885 [Bdellovibrionota bacterium FG-1]
MKTEGLTKGLNGTDRMGLFVGTLLTFVMLPVSLFMAAVPATLFSEAIQTPVLALTVKLAILGAATVLTFFQGILLGLSVSYFAGWALRQLHIQETVSRVLAVMTGKNLKLEACQKTNIGALIGAVGALALFVYQGNTPIHSLTKRVEHLFPGQLVISMGGIFDFDLSHAYAAATGFLAVGFLFAIAGIVSGSLLSATVELAMHRQR